MGEYPEVKWGLTERVLSAFSPTAARRRYQTRIAIEHLRRSYDGAQKNRHTDGWKTSGTAADAEIALAGAVLRDRMRDLVRNNSLAAQAIQVLVNNMVGYGIKPRSASTDEALNKKVDEVWDRWAKRCDAHGHTNFDGILALAVREMLEAGEVFIIKRPRRRRRTRDVPLEIEIREADHLDSAKNESRSDGSRIVQGIEYDASGRRAAYWMFPDHPGDNSQVFRRTVESVRMPASMVIHLFERQRVQSRGVPWGTPAITAIRDLGDWAFAEMVRKKTEACMVGAVLGDEGDGQTGVGTTMTDADGRTIDTLAPGMIAYLRGARDIKFNQPSATPGIREWNLIQMHIIAAGFRVPYALMTGDLSQTNFSSSRVGINEFRRMIELVQWQTIIPMVCEGVRGWFLDAAFLAGEIPTDDVPTEWTPPRFESVNPWQDAQTDLLEVRSGFSSLKEKAAQRGYDVRQLLTDQANALAIADELEVVLDSDPRKVTRVGQAQNVNPGEDEPPPPTGENQRD